MTVCVSDLSHIFHILPSLRQVLVKNISALHPDLDTHYYFSEDKQFVFYTTRVKFVYRHTRRSVYTILDVKNNKQIHLKPSAGLNSRSLL